MLTRTELELQQMVYRAMDSLDDIAGALENDPSLKFTIEMADAIIKEMNRCTDHMER